MDTTNGLRRRVRALEQHRQASAPVFAVHGRAGPDGRCRDCDLPAGDHFTITIERDDRRLERRYFGIDLEAV
jgi:hypothetical protein